ncbi:MAG: lytic transglycosylase domain-containing protein [Pseudolabrys sp.]|nr:lytic transglycosylase domain-containing protein [Pseudolabrys sp.]
MSVESVANSVASQIVTAIKSAARSTGISFEYLLTTARIESNLDPAAKAASSTAKGLYQFIEQTWLATIKQAGPALGLGDYADSITRTADGRYVVTDRTTRDAIMQLRDDPATSSMMAAALARANAAQLAAAIGRTPSESELYIAHFLGVEGAAKLIGAAETAPNASAAALFPQAAAANKSIFYDANGHARSVGEVYGRIAARFAAARAAALDPAPSGALPVKDATAAPGIAPDTAGVTQVLALAGGAPLPRPPRVQSMFTDPARGAVARAVAVLWTRGDGPPVDPATTGGHFDLFTDAPRDPRGPFPGKV